MEELIRYLTRDEIDFKVKSLVKSPKGVFASILAYKDARVDMNLLDEYVGQMDWQCEYKRDTKGVLQCGIGIYDSEKSDWIWKWSNGTASDFEAEKGEYSDAFKRAGFMWGIGRTLYDFPNIWITLLENEYYEKDGKVRATSKLRPNDWEWTITNNYRDVKAHQRIGSEKRLRYDSNPYNKK